MAPDAGGERQVETVRRGDLIGRGAVASQDKAFAEETLVLRRALLAASASTGVRELITTLPVSRDVVSRFVAGDTADQALGVIGALARRRAAGHDRLPRRAHR